MKINTTQEEGTMPAAKTKKSNPITAVEDQLEKTMAEIKAEPKPTRKAKSVVSAERARITAALTKGEMPDGLALHPAEYADEGEHIEVLMLDGYEIELKAEDKGKTVAWMVRATSAVSETPEVIDLSSAYPWKQRGKRQALRSAVFALNKHLRTR